mmetsp:Transcript_27675/g.77550  ORF Transcript_27675/g.77550 Transcript_27675/m.77550 type:complete len:217 (-) Transcript_27675:887-1537(-)
MSLKPNPPSIKRFAAKASFLSHAKNACAASALSNPISAKRSTAAISSSVRRRTCCPLPPPISDPRPAPPPCAIACIMYGCSCSGGIWPSACAVLLSCSGERPTIWAVSLSSLALMDCIICAICAICAGFDMLSMNPADRLAGTPPADLPVAPEDDDDEAAAVSAAMMGSFIISRKVAWFALISAKRSGSCCPICVKTVCNICGLFWTSCRRALNCG